ncbi:MAG: hypothetical protein ACTSSK_00675, partial [Candidatus Heimdallarchaeota archaeon]
MHLQPTALKNTREYGFRNDEKYFSVKKSTNFSFKLLVSFLVCFSLEFFIVFYFDRKLILDYQHKDVSFLDGDVISIWLYNLLYPILF